MAMDEPISEGLQRRLAEQSKRGEGGYSYDSAIDNAASREERETLEKMRDHQLRLREQKRKAATENGVDEQGRVVQGLYAPNKRLIQAAVDEDEFKKMIPSSSASFFRRLRVLDEKAVLSATPCAEQAADDAEEDLSAYGDLFSAEGVHEVAGSGYAEACTLIDIQEGVLVRPRQSWSSWLCDSLIGGTRFDSSGRRALEQRPLSRGGRPHVFLRRPALRRTPQDFLSLRKLAAAGASASEIHELGWDKEGLLKDQIKPLGYWTETLRVEQKKRVAKYDKMPRIKPGVAANMHGVPNAQGKRKRVASDIDDCEGSKRRRADRTDAADRPMYWSTGVKVRFAEDA